MNNEQLRKEIAELRRKQKLRNNYRSKLMSTYHRFSLIYARANYERRRGRQ